jgi:hypothetical protein
MARQVLGIPEDRILEPDKALEALLSRKGPVVFLDDFVGSGQQFVKTWQRKVHLNGNAPMSFEMLASVLRDTQFFYCPLVCTTYGRDEILKQCPMLNLYPAHFLGEEYSAFSLNSLIWPEALQVSATQFIQTASRRAGIDQWQGFRRLGLTVAFEHSVPDATLPLLYWNSNGWKPLIERT